MFVFDLFESQATHIVVIYPGRFQPFHKGHSAVFTELQRKFGRDNVFIGTSNKVDLPKSPFSFTDKVQLMHAAGVHNDRIVEANQPYEIQDYARILGFDPSKTIAIFAVGEPDKQRLEVDSVYTQFTPKPKKDGSPRKSRIPLGKNVGDLKPFLTFKSIGESTTADKHSYVIVVAEKPAQVSINGKTYDASHGTECRMLWNMVRDDETASKEFLTQLYGQATPELIHIFNKIPFDPVVDTATNLEEDFKQRVTDYRPYKYASEIIKFTRTFLDPESEPEVEKDTRELVELARIFAEKGLNAGRLAFLKMSDTNSNLAQKLVQYLSRSDLDPEGDLVDPNWDDVNDYAPIHEKPYEGHLAEKVAVELVKYAERMKRLSLLQHDPRPTPDEEEWMELRRLYAARAHFSSLAAKEYAKSKEDGDLFSKRLAITNDRLYAAEDVKQAIVIFFNKLENKVTEGITPPDQFLNKAERVKSGDVVWWKGKPVGIATGEVKNDKVLFTPNKNTGIESWTSLNNSVASLPIDQVIIKSNSAY